MPFLLLIVGGLIVLVALEGTEGDLATALETDIPPYIKWLAAFLGVGALGYVPGLRSLSNWLLALVITVLVLNNWTQIQKSFLALAQQPAQPVTIPQTTQQQFETATAPISGLSASGTSNAVGANSGFGGAMLTPLSSAQNPEAGGAMPAGGLT